MPRPIGPSGKLMKLCCAAVSIASLLAIDFSRAGPPFVTDDPEPPPPGGWEINVPFILEHASGATEMDAPLFDLNYGLPGIQLKLEIPVEIIHDDRDGTVSGAGDLLLGVKWRFLNNERSQLQLGVYPQLLVPTGDHRAGSAKANLASSCLFSRRKIGRSGLFTATSVIGGEARTKRATTSTREQCSNVKSANNLS